MKEKISVIIPLYNEEDNIREIIHKLEKQSEKNFEIIVVDDGSTDDSVKVIKKIKTNLPLKIIKQKNSGPASARNRGVKKSKGDIICFLDADCIPEQRWIEKIKKNLGGKNLDIIFGSLNNANKDFFSYALEFSWGFMMNDKNKKGEKDLATSANMIVRRGVLNKVLFNPKKIMAEDTDFSIRARKRGFKIYFIPEIRVFHKHKRKSLDRFLKHREMHGFWEMYNMMEYRDSLEKGKFIPKNNLSLLLMESPFIYFWSILRILKGNIKSEPKVLLYLPILLLGNAYWMKGMIDGYKKYFVEKK